MNEFYCILLLLLNWLIATTSTILDIRFPQDTHDFILVPSSFADIEEKLSNITIKHICENENLIINCENMSIIQIIRTNYGRTSQQICNDNHRLIIRKPCFNIEQSKRETRKMCHGQQTCQIYATNDYFIDPCGQEISKHFEVHYRCIKHDEICPKLFLNCSKTRDIKCVQKIEENFPCKCPSTICHFTNMGIINGFIDNLFEQNCPSNLLQGYYWPKTRIKTEISLDCERPCTGEVYRFCGLNNSIKWDNPDYSKCQCPFEHYNTSIENNYYSANMHTFNCNFWLIDKLFMNSLSNSTCIKSFANMFVMQKQSSHRSSSNCLITAFNNMLRYCNEFNSTTFGIEFKNLGFEIQIRPSTFERFRLPNNIYSLDKNAFGSSYIIFDRSDISSLDNEYPTQMLSILLIDSFKIDNSIRSFIVVEQSSITPNIQIQSANVTVIFKHMSLKTKFQCRAYQSNSIEYLSLTDFYFSCKLLCSNGSHVICQCPYFNTIMQYNLHEIETESSINNNDIKLNDHDIDILESNLWDKCHIDYLNSNQTKYGTIQSILDASSKIDIYMKQFSIDNLKKFDKFNNMVSNIINYMDTIIDSKTAWINQNQSSKWSVATKLVSQIDYMGINMVNSLSNRETIIQNIKKHIELTVQLKRKNDIRNTMEFHSKDKFAHISLPKENIEKIETYMFKSIFFVLSNMDKYLNFESNLKLQSKIVSLTINSPSDHHLQLAQDVKITFRHLNFFNSTKQPVCVFLDYNLNGTYARWNNDGCVVQTTNLSHTICSCSHLTAFAVLIDFYNIFDQPSLAPHMDKLSIISKIGCSVSIVCLILTFITLIMIRQKTSNDDELLCVRNTLHKNMVLCLIITQFIFLFGIEQTDTKITCRTIAMLMHYFLLSSFCWMFVDGIELLLALRHVFKIEKSRVMVYYLYSYGVPLIIVMISSVFFIQGYGTTKYCWLAQDHGFIWAFGAPFLILIATNIVFFIISMCTICKHLENEKQAKRSRISLRDLATLSILFGLTWIFGLFFVHKRTLLFAYIFTILNSFQGLLIFVFYCLLRPRIKKLYCDLAFKLCPNLSNFCVQHKLNGRNTSSQSWLRKLLSNQSQCVNSATNQAKVNQQNSNGIKHFSLNGDNLSSGYGSANSADLKHTSVSDTTSTLKNSKLLSAFDRDSTTDFNTDYANNIANEPTYNSVCNDDVDKQLFQSSKFNLKSTDFDHSNYLPSIPLTMSNISHKTVGLTTFHKYQQNHQQSSTSSNVLLYRQNLINNHNIRLFEKIYSSNMTDNTLNEFRTFLPHIQSTAHNDISTDIDEQNRPLVQHAEDHQYYEIGDEQILSASHN